MANWTLVAHTNNGVAEGDGTTAYKIPTGAGTVNTTGANLYVVAVSYYYTDGNPPSLLAAGDLADTTSAGYTKLADVAGAGDSLQVCTWYYKFNPTISTTEQWTLTHTGAGHRTNAGIVCLAFSGCDGSTAPTTASSGTTSSTPTGGSLGTSGQLVLSLVGNYSVDTSSIDSSFIITDHNVYTASNNMGVGVAWNNSSAGVGGAVNPQWTMSGTPTSNVVYNLAFTPSAGGGSTNWGLLLGQRLNRIVQGD